MNLPENVANCVCISSGNPHSLCLGNNGFKERGKQVKLTIKNNETVKAIVLDGCLLPEQTSKCDGLFLFLQGNKIRLLLIELKSLHNIEDACEQFIAVKNNQTYKDLYRHIKNNNKNIQLIEKCFIITTGSISRRTEAKLEKERKIKIKIVTTDKSGRGRSKKAPSTLDLRRELLRKKFH